MAGRGHPDDFEVTDEHRELLARWDDDEWWFQDGLIIVDDLLERDEDDPWTDPDATGGGASSVRYRDSVVETEGTDWSDTPLERDERIAAFDGPVSHAEVREHLRQSGIMEAVEDRFAEMSEREVERPVEEGAHLDMRNAIRRVAGDTTVERLWRRWLPEPDGDMGVCVSVDLSGSMGRWMLDAKSAVGGFLFGAQSAGATVCAVGWSEQDGDADVRLVTGPRERFRWEHLDAVTSGGMTPTSAGIWQGGQLVRRTGERNQLLLVVTDGNPTAKSLDFGCETANEEAEEAVDRVRNLGVSVHGFGFGQVRSDTLRRIFEAPDRHAADERDHVHDVDLADLPTALVDVYEAERSDAARRVVA